MSNASLVPIVVPLAAAALAALGRRSRWLQRIVTLAAVTAVLGIGIHLIASTTGGTVLTTVLGGTDARFRIALVADPLSALVVTVTALVALACTVALIARDDDENRLLLPVLLVLLAGSLGTFVTGDLFNMFVFFEVTLIASYVLLVIGGTAAEARAAAVYVVINLAGSLVFLLGVGLLYGAVGSVNLAVLATETARPPVRAVAEAVVVVAFALKAALLPLGGWLRVAYPVTPRAVSALFAGILTTVGVVAMYRVIPLAFGSTGALTAVLVAGTVTATGAALAAAAPAGRWHIVTLVVMAQAGFMVVGVGLGTVDGIAAGVVFVVQDVIAKTAIFLALSATGDADTGGRDLALHRPVLAATIGVTLVSLAGLPPTSGGIGKALLVRAALLAGQPVVAAVLLLASLLVLAAGVRLWHRTSWQAQEPGGEHRAVAPPVRRRIAAAPAVVLALALLVIGLQPAWLDASARSAAQVLIDPEAYTRQVLP